MFFIITDCNMNQCATSSSPSRQVYFSQNQFAALILPTRDFQSRDLHKRLKEIIIKITIIIIFLNRSSNLFAVKCFPDATN